MEGAAASVVRPLAKGELGYKLRSAPGALGSMEQVSCLTRRDGRAPRVKTRGQIK